MFVFLQGWTGSVNMQLWNVVRRSEYLVRSPAQQVKVSNVGRELCFFFGRLKAASDLCLRDPWGIGDAADSSPVNNF